MYMAKLRRHFEPKHFPWFAVFVMALMVFAVAQLVRAATGGVSGSPGTRYDATQATNYVSTESQSHTLMPNMTVGFVTSSQAPAVVTISSSPGGAHDLNCGYVMRLKVDGIMESVEIPVLLVGPDARSFSFVTSQLAPGSHTANIEWRAESTIGPTGCTEVRSMVVMHQ